VPEPPRGALLAAELVCNGADLVVVGGSARWLRHGGVRPRDLDVVVPPLSIPALVVALARLDVDTDPAVLLRCGNAHLDTAWGPLDVFVATTTPRGGPVSVDGVAVAVQS